MTKIAIVPNAAGTGTFTIEAPNSNSNRTLVLPDAAGELDTLQRAGNVLQVVSTEYAGTFTTTSGSYQSVYSVSITPTSATSRFLLIASVLRSADSWTGGYHFTGLFRDTTFLTEQRANNWSSSAGNTQDNTFSVGLSFVDSPLTASAVTYSVQVASNGSLITSVNRNVSSSNQLGRSTLTVLEIA